MSQESTKPIQGAPPLRLEAGEEYLAPTFAPADVKKANYYTHSTLPPLGKFRKGHELFLVGNTLHRAWVARVFKDDLGGKELELERASTVIGQVSRGMDGYTSSLLTKQTIEVREPQQKKGFWGRLGF